MCGKQFSLKDGLKEAFASDVVLDLFRHNSFTHGELSFKAGELLHVNFSDPFSETPEIYLTKMGQNVPDVMPGYITKDSFDLFSCIRNPSVPLDGRVSFEASGNRGVFQIPLWRVLLSNSKNHQKNKNYRSELIDLESAFEVFIADYLRNKLNGKLKDATIVWLLKNSIENQLNIGFTELNGVPVKRMFQEEYRLWNEAVKEKRDGVVHRGLQISEEEAIKARKAVLNLMLSIDNSAVLHFQVSMNKSVTDGPYMSFGTATIGNEKKQVNWKAYA